MEKELVLRNNLARSFETENQIKICVSPMNSQTLDDSIFNSMVNREEMVNNLECKTFPKHLKMFILIMIWLLCSYPLFMNNEKVQSTHQISIQNGSISSYVIHKDENTKKVEIMLEGAMLPTYYRNLTVDRLNVWIQLLVVKRKPRSTSDLKSADVISMQNVSKLWTVPLVTEKLIGFVPEIKAEKTFDLDLHDVDNSSFTFLRFQFKSNLKTNLPIAMGYNLSPISTDDGIIYAALVLVGLYILIIFEIIHRTLAAMLASTISVAILAALDARPTLHQIVSWIDIETLLLLFSMMILVSVFSETGVFDYLSSLVFRRTRGNIWPLINILCFVVTVLSCFLDNVTTALLITPVTIKLCEVMQINPVPVLTTAIIFGNIGGAITPIGDPPNVIIASNPEVVRSGVNFGTFIMHMGVGIFLSLAATYGLLRFLYRDLSSFKNSEPIEVQDLKRGIAVLQRTAASVSSYSKDEEAVKENLIKKTVKLRGKLKVTKNGNSPRNDKQLLGVMDNHTEIRNKVLLIKSGVTLCIVIGVLFLHSIPSFNTLGMGWTSFLGALLLLLLYGDENIEGIFARVEWCTLLFFASLFILMEALSELGLIDYIGRQTQTVIMAVNPEARLTVAIILMLWVSAVVSAFVDNLPLTTMMVKVATDLANKHELRLPLQPLIWALSFGACLGGNGSLIGSSSNIICAGVAEQHGYKFSFLGFLRVGLPVTFCSITVVNIYLVICHVLFSWH
ncbi:P protein [Sitophilus oryzae]|uniref:P protein n=1 Tax=Sitophilus oryzae TaxID=7048 RepID=A0A6J2YLY3_SITOR|nr:P protein [Sitophilus oryzae]